VFTKEERTKLKYYCQDITVSPCPLDKQKTVRDGQYMWCTDWEIIELLKYMFNEKDMYFEDPCPRRLKDNPFFSKEEIASKAEDIMSNYGTVDSIIKHLESTRGK
jgi:hypothetical protein